MYNTPANATTTTTAGNPYHHHHHVMIPLSPPPFMGGAAADDEFPRRDERFPQWSYQETRDFIEIRAQLEWNFNTAKRNKNLWEMVAARMREKGYRRTLDQCKGKWKNLVNRYKGQETSALENGRQCPFFDELHALFTARANRIQPVQPESETGSSKGKKRLKNVSVDQSYEEVSEEQEDEEETDLDQGGKQRAAPKTKPSGEKRQKTANVEKISGQPLTKNNDNVLSGLQEIMMSFMQQQQMIDMQWKESMEKRAHERDVFEQEWRQTMENLERERLMMEKAWRERDEQRRLREESRAEKRDALLTTLLNKLIRDENH